MTVIFFILIGIASFGLGYIWACMNDSRIEGQLNRLQNTSPKVEDYAKMYQDLKLVIEYLEITKDEPKPRFIKHEKKVR